MRIKKYLTAFIVGVENALEYRLNLLLVLLSCFFPLILQVFMWKALFDGSGSTQIFGYTHPQMILYAVLSTVISRVISADYCGQVASEIKSGDLSKYVVKPISYVGYTIARFLGDKVVSIAVLILISVIVSVIFPMAYAMPIPLNQLALFILAVFIATILKFFISYAFSCLAFWLTEADGILLAINVVGLVISGAYFPLDIFGPAATAFSRALPFYYTVYFPVNTMIGMMTMQEIWIGFGVQLLWILALAAFGQLIWSRGLNKYIAVGG